MAVGIPLKALKGMDLDSDELGISNVSGRFIKNLCLEVNDNKSSTDGNNSGEGENAGVFTPSAGNEIYCGDIPLPEGNNYCIGGREQEESNELYVLVYNSKGDHFIYRIKGDGSKCEIVYKSRCLSFQLNPKFFIPPTRIAIKIALLVDPVTMAEYRQTIIVFTDNNDELHFIPVEDSIATNSFTLPFFNDDACIITRLGVPTPTGCITVKPFREDPISTKTNLINQKLIQFRIRTFDRWGRPSEFSNISTPYYTTLGSCQAGSSGLPRCLIVNFTAAGSTVEYIEVAYRLTVGNAADISVYSDWYSNEIFKKYQDEAGKEWYQRKITNTSRIVYNPANNTFDYQFCYDKGSTSIAPEKTNRLFNPLPLKVSSVAAIGNSIALANCTEGRPPFSKEVLDKISFNIIEPTGTQCIPKTRKVRIVAAIQNANDLNRNQPIWKSSEIEDRFVWGGIGEEYGIFNAVKWEKHLVDFKQSFNPGVTGFGGYFVGQKIFGYSKQYRLNGGVLEDLPPSGEDGTSNTRRRDITAEISDDNKVRLQIWEFENVPEGHQVFRLGWHLNVPSDSLYETTSTFVYGKIEANTYRGVWNQDPMNYEKEIIIPCTGDYDNMKDENFILLISDNSVPHTSTSGGSSSVIAGYLKDGGNVPFELARLIGVGGRDVCQTTDHNGFFFYSSLNNFVGILRIHAKDKCADSVVYDTRFGGDFLDAGTVKLTDTFTKCKSNIIKVKGKVADCNGVGLAGITVFLTRSRYTITDGNGNFTLVARESNSPGDTSLRNNDKIYILQNGVCLLQLCDATCNFCLPPISISLPVCTADCDVERFVTITMPKYRLGSGSSSNGLKSGGIYEWVVVGEDWMGRMNFGQKSEKYTTELPSWQVRGRSGFSQVQVKIDAKFPSWMKKISFWRTKNLALTDYLEWVIDKAEYIDTSGQINAGSPTHIKLYITGLLGYNKLYNLKTNSVFSFEKDDRIEFISKSDGTLYDPNINILVTDSKEGEYLVIAYDSRLTDIKGGEKVAFIRPKDNSNTNLYFEVGCPINIKEDGTPEVTVYTIPTFDTYLFNRSIPYKINDVMISNVFPFGFEHHSPADTWGDHASDLGRVTVSNMLERVRSDKTKVKVSDAYVNAGAYNGLGFYDDANSLIFDENEYGSITAIFGQLSVMLVICEHKNFTTNFRVNNIRISRNNDVEVDNNIFSRPEGKIGNDFGCQEWDVSTIREMQGLVAYVDSSKNAFVIDNYSEAYDISIPSLFSSYMRSKIKHIQSHNQKPEEKYLKYFHMGVDYGKKQFLLTSFAVPKNPTTVVVDDSEYGNSEREVVIEKNETIAYNPYNKSLYDTYAFTPEYYGTLHGHVEDTMLFSFKNGRPWKHSSVNRNTAKFMNYYGVQYEAIYEIVANLDPNKIKRFMCTQVHCREQQFFIDRIITEARQRSRILLSGFEKRENFYTAPFFCDLNTFRDPNLEVLQDPNKIIYEGDVLFGKWAKVRYVSNPKQNGIYFELNGVDIFVIGSEKSGT